MALGELSGAGGMKNITDALGSMGGGGGGNTGAAKNKTRKAKGGANATGDQSKARSMVMRQLSKPFYSW